LDFGGESGIFGGLGGAAVDEPGREERGEKNKDKSKMNEEEADEAGFEEEGEGFVLDDFFRGADFIGEGLEHGGTGSAKANAEDEGLRGLEGGGEGDGIEAETNIGRFGDVALEAGGFLFEVMGNVLKVFGGLEVVFDVFKVGLDE